MLSILTLLITSPRNKFKFDNRFSNLLRSKCATFSDSFRFDIFIIRCLGGYFFRKQCSFSPPRDVEAVTTRWCMFRISCVNGLNRGVRCGSEYCRVPRKWKDLMCYVTLIGIVTDNYHQATSLRLRSSQKRVHVILGSVTLPCTVLPFWVVLWVAAGFW